MQVAYKKMHGTGNRILVVDQRGEDRAPPSAQTLQVLGDDSTGPGFDQLMWVTEAREPDNAASYRVFNRDGSEVEQCGNGVRCVAKMLASRATASLVLESPAGLVEARVLEDGAVSVSMGRPEFEPSRIPFVAEAKASQYLLDVNGAQHGVQVVSIIRDGEENLDPTGDDTLHEGDRLVVQGRRGDLEGRLELRDFELGELGSVSMAGATSSVSGIVVRLDHAVFREIGYNREGEVNRLRAMAGADLAKTLMDAARRGLDGLSQMAGIPATASDDAVSLPVSAYLVPP